MRTRKTVVILISGKAGSGKGAVADFLEAKLKDIPSMTTFRYAFAGPLKYVAKAYMGWNGAKDEKGRKLLQDIGRIGREYDPVIWVKHALNQMDKRAGILPFNFVVIDDWRFPNELNFLKDNPMLDIVTIRVFGRGGLSGEVASDISENSLPEVSAEFIPNEIEGDHWYDFQLDNSGELDVLETKVDRVLSEISKEYIIE